MNVKSNHEPTLTEIFSLLGTVKDLLVGNQDRVTGLETRMDVVEEKVDATADHEERISSAETAIVKLTARLP